MKPQITVCICTYRRPDKLSRLLSSFNELKWKGHLWISILIVDNDSNESARAVVSEFKSRLECPVLYLVEPEQSIAKARNRAVENARSDLIAFIDDDERPDPNWLISALQNMEAFCADGVLGPVKPEYLGDPPKWVIQGKFYERKRHETGTILTWKETRTGNVLMKRSIFLSRENLFRLQFARGGEDRDLFRRLIKQGYRFVWCDEAVVYESISPIRYSRQFMLKRALIRGTLPHFGNMEYCKSVIAIPLYLLILPILLIAPHHLFMAYLVKLFDHIGRIFQFLGVDLVKEKYLTG